MTRWALQVDDKVTDDTPSHHCLIVRFIPWNREQVQSDESEDRNIECNKEQQFMPQTLFSLGASCKWSHKSM